MNLIQRFGAVHFRYDWVMKDGAQTSFECIDVIVLSDCGKIKELTIIYDTFGIRDAFMNDTDLSKVLA